MTWQTQDTRRQRQRTGGQSGRLRRIDSKGAHIPDGPLCVCGHASAAGASSPASGPIIYRRGRGARRGRLCESPGRFPARQPVGLSGRLKLCGNRSTWNEPIRDAISCTLPHKARGQGQEYRY